MRPIYILSFLLALFSFGNTAVNAAEDHCDEAIVQVVGNHFKIKDFAPRDEDGVIVAKSCKLWPYKNNIVLVAFAFTPEVGGKQDVEYEKNLIVAMIDKATQRVVSSNQSIIYEDAITEIGPDSFELDTARYQLTPDVRAFGLRFNSSARGPSCGEGRSSNELTLFVPEGDKLRSVLRLYMYRQQSIQGCLSVYSEGAVWEDAGLTISVEKTRTNGYADLLVTARIEPGSNGVIDENAKARVEHHLLHYSGNGYLIGPNTPWWLSY
jgi:hypothetical protein